LKFLIPALTKAFEGSLNKPNPRERGDDIQNLLTPGVQQNSLHSEDIIEPGSLAKAGKRVNVKVRKAA